MQKVFQIGSRSVGEGQSTFITAEIGLNHGGEPHQAKQLVTAAARSGADAVKFQIFRAESFVSRDTERTKDQKASVSSDETPFEMFRRLEMPPELLGELHDLAHKSGLILYGSAFDSRSVDVLAAMDVEVFKIASGELTNLPLIQKAAEKQKPMIMSVGMAALGEIEEALTVVHKAGCERVALLHCVANYPTEYINVNLRRMERLRRVFDVPVGYSDHTTSNWVSLAAVALGASFVEKHFTLDRSLPGPDHALSADPADLKALVEGVRAVESSLGSGSLGRLETENEVRKLARRSLVATRTIPTGDTITRDSISAKRPEGGIEPKHLELIIGRTARREIRTGSPVTWEDV